MLERDEIILGTAPLLAQPSQLIYGRASTLFRAPKKTQGAYRKKKEDTESTTQHTLFHQQLACMPFDFLSFFADNKCVICSIRSWLSQCHTRKINTPSVLEYSYFYNFFSNQTFSTLTMDGITIIKVDNIKLMLIDSK